MPQSVCRSPNLNSYHLISLARVREWFIDCVGQAVSEATIEKAVNQLADAERRTTQ